MPVSSLHLQDPTMNILQNLQQVQAANVLPTTLVVSFPTLKVMSFGQGQGQKPTPALQEIPISALDQSLSGKGYETVGARDSVCRIGRGKIHRGEPAKCKSRANGQLGHVPGGSVGKHFRARIPFVDG